MDLRNLIDTHLDLPQLSKVLDELGTEGRVWSVRQWTRAHQATLWEAAKGVRAITLDDFVPPSIGALVPVIHHGQNSLPMHTHFQKRFAKLPEGDGAPAAPDGARLVGYNEQTLAAFSGPGYFMVHPSTEAGEVDIDYTMVPTVKPTTWPPIVPNSVRLAPVIYGGMIDVMRGISSHVTIGRARRKHGWMDNWFVLVREDPRPA
jgi:hypothetical protein